MTKHKIKKGDLVVVISGDHKGSKANVTRVLPKTNKVFVEGVNMVKRHQKPTAGNTQGGIIEKEAPLHISKVILVDPASKTGSKVGRRLTNDGVLERYFKKSGQTVKS